MGFLLPKIHSSLLWAFYYLEEEWVTDVWGMIALGGFFFVCGLPGWALVRWIFNFIDKQEGKTIVEVIKEFKKARKDIENS